MNNLIEISYLKRDYNMKKRFLQLWNQGKRREQIHVVFEKEFYLSKRQQQNILGDTKDIIALGFEGLMDEFNTKLKNIKKCKTRK